MKDLLKDVWVWWLMVGVAGGWTAGLAQETTPQQMAERMKVKWEKVPKKVLTFYYGWYGNPEVTGRWVHWRDVDEVNRRIGSSTHYPELGSYDTHDPKVVEQHCRWAKEAGIDGFIATWWQPNDFHDQGMPLLLKTAQKFGLAITAYFETVPNERREEALSDVLYLLEQYGRHPAWLKVEGKPVLFVYGRALGQIGMNGWVWVMTEANRQYPGGALFIGDKLSKQTARIFDGIHTYCITGSTQGKSPEEIRMWAREAFGRLKETPKGRILCLTIIPGYDDSKLGRPAPRPITDRHGGQTYRVLWEEAIAANPDWVLITSWNEWHEGSEIEPSVEYGERELKTTAEFAPRFQALPPRSPSGPVSLPTVSEKERAALSKSLESIPVAVLPDADSEAVWFLLSLGVTPSILTWEGVLDSRQFNPEQFPITVYAAGETYRPTVRAENDVLEALQEYVRRGGVLMVLPSQPMPFHYGEKRQTVAHWRKLGMPLNIAWERPPADMTLKFIVRDGKALPHVPQSFAFPSTGDLRWRPLLPEQAAQGVSVTPLLEVEDDRGESCGVAAGIMHVGRGHIVYAWFRLLDIPEGEDAMFDLWQVALEKAAEAASSGE